MNADTLLQAIIDYGADLNGIQDRFGDNTELYLRCVAEFLENPGMAELGAAVGEGDFDRAFDAAHSLKGLSGNLGLSGCYDAICALVESLRAKSYENVDAQYALVERELENLRLICRGEAPLPLPVPAPSPEEPTERAGATAKKAQPKNKFIYIAALTVLIVFLMSLAAFYAVGRNFRIKTRQESGQHLLEIGSQIGMYLDGQMDSDWKVVESVCKTVLRNRWGDNEAALAEMIDEQRQVWDVADLILYTENGYCINARGETEPNGVASSTIAQAREKGSAFEIIDSELIYTLPLHTQQTLNGSKLAAVSVVRDMDTFLDRLDLSSYDDRAQMYLTDDSGVVISRLSSGGSSYVFNIYTILDKCVISPLVESEPHWEAPSSSSSSSSSSYMTDGVEDRYLVSVPISSDNVEGIQLRLFYIVPVAAANYSSNIFSSQLTVFSLFITVTLTGMAAAAFLLMYKGRKRKFDAALSAREKMFDLLVENIRAVFALFETDRTEPVYISANAPDILGDSYWAIEKTEDGYRARSGDHRDTNMLSQTNALLADWDGKSPFRSGYLCNDETLPPTYFELTLYPVGQDGTELVGIILDVSAAHDREEAAKSAMEMAKRSDGAKTRFLANMSHDIRTPMNAIMNMSRFALDSDSQPKKQKEYLRTIYDSAEHLLHLINDVLDMSRIESGQMTVASQPFDVKAVLKAQAEAVRMLCLAKRQTFIVDLDGIRAEAVLGDSLKVAQVIVNLLSNAVKFTPEGGAVRFIGTELPSLRDDIVSLRLSVEDNGIGISRDYMQHIFEPFSRADDKRVDRTEGTGLGLSIVKNYVEAMGGTISCASEAGEGSTFTVELFFQRSSMEKSRLAKADIQSNTPFMGMRCLVAEDIPTNQLIAKTLLERVGFLVELANDGREALNKFTRSLPQTYDVVYMDIQMPVLDGYQATVMMRNSSHAQAKTIPIIAMSANVFAEDIEKARIAGMDGYIGKPIVSMELVEQTFKAMEIRKGKSL